MGFFSESTLLKEEKQELSEPQCARCGLYKKCESPKIQVCGKGRRRVMIVGEAPGEDEDEQGKFFVGRSGQKQDEILRRLKVKVNKDCWTTNALICRPPGNATPTLEQIQYCRPNLVNAIEKYDPDVIITVGMAGLQSVLHGGVWMDPMGRMGSWTGWAIPCQKLNRWIVPTYHPSFLLRVLKEQERKKRKTPIEKIIREHYAQAFKLEGKPYKKSPQWEKKIEAITNPKYVVRAINKFIRLGGPIGFDLETNMLKPDKRSGSSDDSKLVSASICWRGVKGRTISFPFTRRTRKAFKRLMLAPNPKVAHGFKFEDRWIGREYEKNGQKSREKIEHFEINNWAMCTMNTAHLLDNRKGIVSLDFQALVRLGVSQWGRHISPFLKQDRSYGLNRIRECDLNDLLIYGGMDSLTCLELAHAQRKDLNLPPL